MKNKIVFLGVFLLTFINLSAQDYYFYRVDTIQSKIFWKCDKHNGIIKLKDGGFVLENKEIIAGLFFINLNSLAVKDLDNKQYGTAKLILENTLKNEFFEIKKYPNAFFKLEEIKKNKDGKFLVKGDLSFHGITNCIEFPAIIDFQKNIIKLISDKFSINRSEWGIYRMSPSRPYQDDENGWTVSDIVEIKIELIAKKNR